MIKRLAKCIKGYTTSTVLTPIFMLGEVIFELLIPFLMSSKILDYLDGVQKLKYELDFSHLILWGLVLIACGLCSFAFGTLAGITSAKAASGFGANLRRDLYYSVQNFSFTNIDKYQTSSLVTRLTTDVTNVQNSFMMIIRIAVRSPLMLIFSIFFAMQLYPQVGWIYLAVVPVLVGGLGIIAAIAMPMFTRIFKKYDALNESVQENIKGMRVVKSYVREDYEKQKFEVSSENVRKLFTKAEKVLAFNNPIMMLCVYATMLTVVIICSIAGINGDLTIVSKLQSLIAYAISVLISLMMFSMIFVMITFSVASAKRICEVLNEQSDIVNPENPIYEVKNGDISFKDVNFKYNKNAKANALFGVNLEIKSGETVGVIGGTGSSKSTLISLISRLYDVTDGEVKVGGINVKEYDLDTLRNNVSVVLQKNLLFSGTIAENIRWGDLKASDEDVERVCKLAQADEFIQSFPDKYNTHIEQGGTNVSGGQKQRLCIARALLKKPKVLILDDSTSAVDTRTDSLIRAAFKNEIPDTTKIIIAQRIASIQDADKIVVMDNGTINAIGTHDELLKNNEIYQEVYYTQNKIKEDK